MTPEVSSSLERERERLIYWHWGKFKNLKTQRKQDSPKAHWKLFKDKLPNNCSHLSSCYVFLLWNDISSIFQLIKYSSKTMHCRAGETAQQLRVHAAHAEDQSSSSSTHSTYQGNLLPSSGICRHCIHMYNTTQTHIIVPLKGVAMFIWSYFSLL